MTQKRKDLEGREEESSFDAGFQIPKTQGTVSKLQAALRAEHAFQQEEEDKQDQGKGKKQKKQRPKGVICCCGSPSCSIGPMVETQGGEESA